MSKEKPTKTIKKEEKIKDKKVSKMSISTLVINAFKKTPKIKSKEMIEMVLVLNPESKFNVYHYSWYKYQIKKGRYTNQFESKQLKAIFG